MSKLQDEYDSSIFHQILDLRDTCSASDFFGQALERICGHFGLQKSFIYSADHTQALKLLDSYCVSGDAELLEEIVIDELLSPRESYQFFNSDFLLFANGRSLAMPKTQLTVMDYPIFLATPMYDAEEQFRSFVAVTSDDENRQLSEDEVIELVACLKIVAHVMKVRFYKSRLTLSKNTLADILDNTGVDIYVNDFYTKEILYVNKSMAEPYGGIEAMLGKICWKTLYDDKTGPCDFCPQQHLIAEDGNPTKIYGWDYQRPFDGAWFRVLSSAFPWVDGRIAQVISSIDITQDKKNQALVAKMAYYDALTGIGNRRKFEMDFTEMLQTFSKKGGSGFVLFADLDDFKYINDAFGHEVGDLQLAAIGNYINSLDKCQNRAYRYGGDEFIVLLESVTKEEAMAITNQIIDRCKKPWNLKGKDYYCTISFGMASFPEDGITHDELLTSADSAMYVAKTSGKSKMAVYDSASQDKFSKIKMEFALRKTVENGFDEFSLVYNPIIDTKTKEIMALEALLRWNSPIYGNLEPPQFMDILLSRSLMIPVGHWIVETGIKTLQDLNFFEKEGFYVSFNISKYEYLNENFDNFIIDTMKKYQIPPASLMLEVNANQKKLDEIHERTDFFRDHGIQISIDNFGLGGCSPDIIDKINVDMVKVDKDAVIHCLNSDFSKTLVKTFPMLAHAAGIKICAEGVESAEAEAFLLESEYDYIQGTYVSSLVADKFSGIRLV